MQGPLGVLAATVALLGAAVAGASNPLQPAQCAAKAPSALPGNAWAPARRQLAPPGASAIRLCRYSALNQRPARALARSVLVSDAKTVRAIVSELDSLRVSASPRPFCPLDDGAVIDALLAYPGGNGVVIQIELTGCANANNGNVTRTTAQTRAGTELLASVERLTGYTRPVF